jgi:HSP20 family protein
MNALSTLDSFFGGNDFDRIFHPLFVNNGKGEDGAAPRVDVRELKDKYVIDMDLPGVDEKDIEVNVKNHVLTVTARHSEEAEKEETGNYIIRERRKFNFSRKFTLGDDVDDDNVNANFDCGVLAVELPKRPKEEPRQIKINGRNAS